MFFFRWNLDGHGSVSLSDVVRIRRGGSDDSEPPDAATK